ncbi:roadblock/LC7 domain-containing protein [Nocardia sp. NPDC006982]|uniref:roadblock/LC7 domain-containing protein n=1 Tax=Nocardia sp. NPDC006982 TaxID=3364307 RepID=UPI0036782F64
MLGRSTDMSVEDAEHFAAMSSAVHSLARSAGHRFDGGGVRQSVIELDRAVLFVTSAGSNACLALLANDTANLGMVAYEMNQTVQRVGTFLSAAPARPTRARKSSGYGNDLECTAIRPRCGSAGAPLCRDPLGAVVLADTRRLESSFAAVDYFENRRTPFVVGINCFDGAPRYSTEEVRAALDLDDRVPVRLCDVRARDSAKDVLVELLEHLISVQATRT